MKNINGIIIGINGCDIIEQNVWLAPVALSIS